MNDTLCPEHCPLCKGIISPIIGDELVYWCGNCRLKFKIIVYYKTKEADG